MLKREEILKCIVDSIEPLEYVNAAWQCGSAAFGRVDEWSDIDIAVDVEDDMVKEIFKVTDKALETLSPIESTYECPQPMSEGAYQKVYKLKDASKFLIIEICAVRHGATDKFLQKEIHGNAFVHFDKKNVTEYKSLDKKEHAKKLKKRLEQIKNLFNIYQILVDKEYNRKNYIEAVAFYNNFSLSLLLEAVRIRYSPYRFGFRTRYVYYDLPEEVVNKLTGFYFIKDSEDLKRKHEETIKWFNEVVGELETIDLEKLL